MGTRRFLHPAIAALLAVLFCVCAAVPAFALTDPKVTLDQQTGGQPTRFTFVTTTDADADISSIDIKFPKGYSRK